MNIKPIRSAWLCSGVTWYNVYNNAFVHMDRAIPWTTCSVLNYTDSNLQENRPWRVQKQWFRPRPTTGNSDTGIRYFTQTGSTYISKCKTDIVEISSIANLVFNHIEKSIAFYQALTTGNSRRNRKYFYRWNYNRHHWISNGKALNFTTVDRELAKSDGKWSQQRPTTGNSDMVAKTGNTYSSGKRHIASKF